MLERTMHRIAAIGLGIAALAAGTDAAAKEPPLGECPFFTSDTPKAVIQVTGPCVVPKSSVPYKLDVISIQDKGVLQFIDDNGSIDLWARAIIVENGGKLIIGSPGQPIGTKDPKTKVTIHL